MLKSKSNIKKGDEVIVIAGKDKGRRGTVKQVRCSGSGCTKLLIEGINMVKKHVKPNPQAGKPGGIIAQEAFIDRSNVMMVNTTTNKAERIGFRFLEDGKKVRCFKSSGEIVDVDKS